MSCRPHRRGVGREGAGAVGRSSLRRKPVHVGASPNMFAWKAGTISYDEWQRAGEDSGGTFTLSSRSSQDHASYCLASSLFALFVLDHFLKFGLVSLGLGRAELALPWR